MNKRVASLTVIVLLFALLAWADKKFSFNNNSNLNPAAAGSVNVGTDRNGNNSFDVHVYHLSDPGQLTPARSVYVIWAQENGKPAQNLGKLTVNRDLEGSFHGISPAKHFELFITAEDSDKAETPSNMELLRTKVSH